jgi:hypothetical protein
VLVFRDQDLGAPELAAFGRRFGVPRPHALTKYRHVDCPEVSWREAYLGSGGSKNDRGADRVPSPGDERTPAPNPPALCLQTANSLSFQHPGRRRSAMGLFGELMNKIFNRATSGEAAAASPASSPAAAGSPGSGSPTQAPAQVASQVDVAAILDRMASESKQKLDWKHSIVDLMKLVGMDSSLSARRELAADLHYSGDTNDTATMNMWLHKEVMKKLAENGGRVPAELLSR